MDDYLSLSRHVQSLTGVGQLQIEDGGRQYVVLVHCSGSQDTVCGLQLHILHLDEKKYSHEQTTPAAGCIPVISSLVPQDPNPPV